MQTEENQNLQNEQEKEVKTNVQIQRVDERSVCHMLYFWFELKFLKFKNKTKNMDTINCNL